MDTDGYHPVTKRRMQRFLLDIMTLSHGNMFCVTGPLCGEFTSHWWIPLTKANNTELWCFLWSVPWINGWVNNCEAGDLRHHHAHYDIIVMNITGLCYNHQIWAHIMQNAQCVDHCFLYLTAVPMILHHVENVWMIYTEYVICFHHSSYWYKNSVSVPQVFKMFLKSRSPRLQLMTKLLSLQVSVLYEPSCWLARIWACHFLTNYLSFWVACSKYKYSQSHFNTLRLRQHDWHFAEDFFSN